MPRLLWVHAVDRLDLEQGVILLVIARSPHLTGDLVATTQFEPSDLG